MATVTIFGFSIHLALNECFKSLLEVGAGKKFSELGIIPYVIGLK
jgi:hypothetical protein